MKSKEEIEKDLKDGNISLEGANFFINLLILEQLEKLNSSNDLKKKVKSNNINNNLEEK